MTDGAGKTLLVVANETVGGTALIDAVKRHTEKGDTRVVVICPQNQPKHGYVVYDDTVRTAADNRLKTTLAQLREIGVRAEGEIVDPDPYSAVMDSLIQHEPDEIIISTHPHTRSGWLRKHLVDRVAHDTGLPVEHVVVDLDADRAEALNTLVVANQTVGGQPLFDLLKRKAAEKPRRFVVICPQSQTEEGDDAAHERLAHMLHHLEEEGLDAAGQVMHPDPFTAIQNALQFYAIDEIVISTFPEARSGWLRNDLIERVRASTSKPVEHVVVSEEEAEEGATA
jgi:hypothetical protein